MPSGTHPNQSHPVSHQCHLCAPCPTPSGQDEVGEEKQREEPGEELSAPWRRVPDLVALCRNTPKLSCPSGTTQEVKSTLIFKTLGRVFSLCSPTEPLTIRDPLCSTLPTPTDPSHICPRAPNPPGTKLPGSGTDLGTRVASAPRYLQSLPTSRGHPDGCPLSVLRTKPRGYRAPDGDDSGPEDPAERSIDR